MPRRQRYVDLDCYYIDSNFNTNTQKLNIPTHPPMWYKPPSALSNPEENIPIPKQAHESFLDFEVHTNSDLINTPIS